MTQPPQLLVGLMAGTSLDGVDAALVELRSPTQARLVAFASRPYGADERAAIRAAFTRGSASAYAELHVRLAEWAAEGVEAVLAQAHLPATRLAGIAFPGQTIWHEPPRVSWQLGEPAVLAERFGVPVVSNFRARDVAAGGQGAPLVPVADVLLFGRADGPRVLVNIGGMANFTVVPRAADDAGAFACDTGPGMAVIDAVASLADPRVRLDRDGELSARGTPDEALLLELLADPYFAEPPPKSTGRERFGDGLARLIAERRPGPDGVATAVELTGRSLAEAIARWTPAEADIVVSGGGARHPGVRASLERHLSRLRGRVVTVTPFDTLFFDMSAKEPVAFALLGYLTLHGQPGNLPAATGARGPRVLGCVTPA